MSFVLALFAAPAAVHSQPFDAEKILLPVVIRGQVAGAYGSLWETRLAIMNQGATPLMVDGLQTTCPFPPCFPAVLDPDSTLFAHPVQADASGRGVFVFVERARADELQSHLRVQDVSRQQQTWGTRIPTIRERDAITGEAHLIDIPADSSFRTLVRFYDFEPEVPRELDVRIFRIETTREFPDQQRPDQLLAHLSVTMHPPGPGARRPGYGELALSTLTALGDSGVIRIEIEPRTPGTRYWAFASVTNNETQHVTIVAPD